MAEEKAFMAFVLDDIGAFFNMMMILQFPIAGFLTWLRLPNGHYTLGAYLCQRLSVGPCARLQPLIPRLAESPSREWIPAAPFISLCLVHHRLCLFSYFRLRHGNLKFLKGHLEYQLHHWSIRPMPLCRNADGYRLFLFTLIVAGGLMYPSIILHKQIRL